MIERLREAAIVLSASLRGEERVSPNVMLQDQPTSISVTHNNGHDENDL